MSLLRPHLEAKWMLLCYRRDWSHFSPLSVHNIISTSLRTGFVANFIYAPTHWWVTSLEAYPGSRQSISSVCLLFISISLFQSELSWICELLYTEASTGKKCINLIFQNVCLRWGISTRCVKLFSKAEYQFIYSNFCRVTLLKVSRCKIWWFVNWVFVKCSLIADAVESWDHLIEFHWTSLLHFSWLQYLSTKTSTSHGIFKFSLYFTTYFNSSNNMFFRVMLIWPHYWYHLISSLF